MSKEIRTFIRLNDEEKRQLICRNLLLFPQICVCRSFVALLRSDGSVIVRDRQKETEIFRNIRKISAGEDHILCLCFDDTAAAYGDNSYGQCDVSEWKNITDIQAGKNSSAALTQNEKLLVAGFLNGGSRPEDKMPSADDLGVFDEIRGINEKYAANDGNGSMNDNQNIRTFGGDIPVIFSAPHSVRYRRNEEDRPANAYTGVIAEYLSKKYGVHGIVRTGNLGDDPNGSKSKYKNILENYISRYKIRYLFDIYGCSDEHGFDIDICTGKGRNINQQYDGLHLLESGLSRLGKLSVDEYGNTAGRNYICNYIHKRTHITCVRLEICASLRKNPEKLVSLIGELGNFIKFLQEYSDKVPNNDR